ncbi:MAG: cellulase family glycosylhydrolase, partial [Ignavibacteria bacterium]|nr:cellulase family glycosylhydrolase [Ignavibacteria bacterium]
WESDLNKQKTIAFWEKIAERYANEAWIGGYDIINETNWSFEEGKNINGIHDTSNVALLELFTKVTEAIRANDKNHIIFIEGNGWANNFNGLTPPWDGNMVYSFHHYWQRNVQPSIQKYIDMRTQYNVPIWMGEAGENSNEWFAEAISLLEANEIGWAWWPYKKFESNVSLITVNPSKDYQQIIDYQRNPSVNPRPNEAIAYAALMQLAANHKVEACKVNKSYHDALFRQIASTATIPYADNIVPGNIAAVDYDLGRLNAAYFDKDYANYYISDGGERVVYNAGGAYRNDGVDIYKDETIVGNSFFVDKIESGEWLTYTLDVQESANYALGFQLLPSNSTGEITVILNDSLIATLAIDAQQKERNWTTFNMQAQLEKGKVPLKIQFKQGGFAFKSIDFTISDTTVESKN